MDILALLGRTAPLFSVDLDMHGQEMNELTSGHKFLVLGGAGSIGKAVTKEIFKRNPASLHVVDISENNLVELVRDIRSTLGYIDGDFRTFALDCGSREFSALTNANEKYDYILNLSALKHVRSERDPFTLMRMIEVNILNTLEVAQLARKQKADKFFCVSTDKAANPVNMMGASKRIMEMFLMRESASLNISTARFANVAFSDGSLLHGFNQRFVNKQPISAPKDVKRYFVTPQESGELCLLSCLLGENRDIFFPKINEELTLTTFADIAERYLAQLGYSPFQCSTEQEARERTDELIAANKWPCYFFSSDTAGEKDFEEFFTEKEEVDFGRFHNLGVIKNKLGEDSDKLEEFLTAIDELRRKEHWGKPELVALFTDLIPEFQHKETGKYLDERM